MTFEKPPAFTDSAFDMAMHFVTDARNEDEVKDDNDALEQDSEE